MSKESTVYLRIHNQSGSVEHYYHFLLGFLLPLALKLEQLEQDDGVDDVLIRSCGPMDRIIGELNYRKLHILSKEAHQSFDYSNPENPRSVREESLAGMDFRHGNYPQKDIRNAVSLIRTRLSEKIEHHRREDLQGFTDRHNAVVLINRSTDPFFDSSKAEIPRSGLQRRSIRNFPMVRRAVEEAREKTLTITLEDKSLAFQVALFSQFRTIIAQHGAALVNVVWCDPGTHIVEIAPKGYRSDCFPPLSKCIGAKHSLVNQGGVHGDCDIGELLLCLRS